MSDFHVSVPLSARLASEPFALSFSGQGYAWLPTLRDALATGAQPHIAEYLAKTEELLAPLEEELLPATPHGFAPLDWTDEEPAWAHALADASLSTPGILTAQLAVLESLRAHGIELEDAVTNIGHSQGVLATAVVEGRMSPAEALALARLIGAALETTARSAGLVRTPQGAPMAAVTGATKQQLLDAGAHIGLDNGRGRFVIGGTPAELARVKAALQESSDLKEDREGEPAAVAVTDLEVSAAFHHPTMKHAVEQVESWADRIGLDPEPTAQLARAVLTDYVDWPERIDSALEAGARWILEVGPSRGVEPLTRELVAGHGVSTLAVGTEEGLAQLVEPGRAPSLPRAWSEWTPRVESGRLATAFTRATGYSPVMLPGMTPTTVDPGIVAAAANAGHWAELAGGGQHTDDILKESLHTLGRMLQPGVNAQFNALYLAASQWRRQIEGPNSILRARAGGAPINGVVVSAGIPPVEEAVELVEKLHAANIPWVAFKPGTSAQVEEVLRIADALPETTIIMQLEGSAAGGHHSLEGLDEVLVATYARIRERDNVLLAVGGGIGTPARGAEYLLGTWAQRFGLPAAPVDAIMVGTAAMAAKESTASESVKHALVAAHSGDVVSGRSDLGADIHELDNSFARAGRLLDAVAGDAAAVEARRAEIIEAIGRTCKPYFGDLDEMSYSEWLQRYLELSYLDGWVDESWLSRFTRMVTRAEARLHPADHGEIELCVEVDREHPAEAIAQLTELYGDAALHPTDAAWFIQLVDSPGKPANFVPVIDADVRRRWRHDTLWQAHNERYSADEVCIIPGTSAVEGITQANVPVAQILGCFEQAALALLDGTDDDSGEPAFSAEELICRAPSLNWAGREQPNPLRLGLDGAELETAGEEAMWLTVPFHSGAGLRVRITLPRIPGASPLVTVDDAESAMRELLRQAAGGDLPEVDSGAATVNVHLNATDIAQYGAVTSGEMSTAVSPDVLLGRAWPALFAVLASAHTESGEPLVEGFLDLVHFEHSLSLTPDTRELLRSSAAPGSEPLALSYIAELKDVRDTPSGRLIDVSVAVNVAVHGEEHEFAQMHERFLITGRRGGTALELVRATTNGAQESGQEDSVKSSFRETPRSFRHRTTAVAPQSLRPFAVVTGDRNPIHLSSNAAALAGHRQGPIVHGMWTSALAQAAVAFDGARVLEWSVTWLAPVLPGSEVEFEVERVGVDKRSGYGEIRSVTATSQGVPVLQARATMSSPTTFYAFPGQGIQSPGMGMKDYAESAAARAVWERADEHTRQSLGFSILEIVRHNPDTVVVAGETFTHPDGVLYLTQFTQVAMATLGCAQIAALKESEVLESCAFFAGHSVGEYNALAAYAEVLSLEAVLDIVYVRGLTMHHLVERDAAGQSLYGLAALRPHKMGMSAGEAFADVARVAAETGEFLEVVNHNIAGLQYAVAGTKAGLDALAHDAERRAAGQRAVIPISGIDVPFHSSRLVSGVADFRAHLNALIPQEVNLEVLVGRYIPNLVARPFALSREFVEAIAEVVDSEPIAEILADFDGAMASPARLGRTLLIELLAWQFASPVRWIETQDLLLGQLGVERFLEVGVGAAPTLTNMLGQTLRLPQYAGSAGIEVLNYERDHGRVFAEDAEPAPGPAAKAVAEHAAQPVSAEAESVESESRQAIDRAHQEETVQAPREEAPAAIEDLPLSVHQALEMLIALWTKVRPDQIAPTDSIETLVEGVSSRRNQLLVDLGSEFGISAIENAADAAIPQLAESVAQRAPGYATFGEVLSEQVSQALTRLTGPAGKKPGYVAERVSGTWGLGTGWADHATVQLVLGTREGSSLRGGDLASLPMTAVVSVAELDELIDSAVRAAGECEGIALQKAAAATPHETVDPEAVRAYTERLESALEDSARAALAALGREETPIEQGDSAAHTELEQLVATELGPDWQQRVAPAFDARKAVLLDDRWASAREDIARAAAAGEAEPELDVLGAGEEVALLAEHFGYEHLARDARTPADGLLFADQVAVVTGGSPGSIAAELIGELLAEGATVIATTSQLKHERLEFYKELYRSRAVGAAALWVVPANLSSFADVDALVEWIAAEHTAIVGGKSVQLKPAYVPDLLFPFAAPRVAGTLVDAGAGAESQMRLLLWSVEKLIASLSAVGADTHVGHRLHVVLPGSPNRGRFGGDGAYGEAKAALDALVNRWSSEQSSWGARTSLVHAHIGWVRGTGLMGGNDPLVAQVEARGVRTFSAKEMAVQLIDATASPHIRAQAASSPLSFDLTGGLAEAELDLAALARDSQSEDADASSAAARSGEEKAPRTAKALPNVLKPAEWTSPDFNTVTQSLEDMVVIVGAGELGPLGSSRTRYEAEVGGELSAAGVLELAWSRGLISWDEHTAGWLTAEGEEIAEEDVYARFHDEVLAGIGVRRFHDDFGPHLPMVDNLAPELTTIYLEKPLSFTVGDEATARSFVDSCEGATLRRVDGATGEVEWQVTRPAGSAVRVPRRVAMTRFVGGQIPEGFDPQVYGIPADMVDNLDRLALWNLVCTVDAFLSAGFSPAELLTHVHPARVSSTQGTGMAGQEALRSLYVDKLLAQPRPNDILQEALPNVIAAHVMQSYVGGYGQMVHPVAACATAAVSVEEGVDKLRLHKADFVVAGGIDALSIEGITGFGDMAATADSAEMAAKGIEHRFFSRANDRRRAGFVESEGGGTILLARGTFAAEMGLPVLGVVGFAESFADGAHTSIPAPGLGALSAARGGTNSRLARSLKALGVGADDIAVVSKHDTSTNANDPNESDLHERIAAALGRSPGNPLYVVSQKSLTGHAKGGAAAFQLVGLTQALRSGVLPPNRSLDCVDPALRRHSHLLWLRQPLDLRRTPPKAGLVTSLGFGHVSALIALVHPGAFFAALAREQGGGVAEAWRAAATDRERRGLRRLEDAMRGGAALYERPVNRNLGSGPATEVTEREAAALLSESARLRGGTLDPEGGNTTQRG
ncbi:type I polyketide synthase [Corynebacterium sp. HMSC074A09]|uniref:type I polyketide synthase n=1 Tax=Corynebacterium sp. HMSC074A09 TaxID=1739311 RepID=UPI0008A43EF5|nr:type I polyketide synthase [Corynebacterium sp. HMSC074A09]OFK66034.1 3-oxoacyl-ACP synthase [Corynebacterium sp. HMSC074A09]